MIWICGAVLGWVAAWFVVVGGGRRGERGASGDDVSEERIQDLLRVIVRGFGIRGAGVSGIGRRGGRHIVREFIRRCFRQFEICGEFRNGNRIWSVRGGKGLGRSDSEGGGLPFALLLGGLDEFGVGADFEVGILQGGEGEAMVAKFLKVPFHISLLSEGSIRETKKQLYGGMDFCKNVWSFVQARYSFSTYWPR